jgi:hypothetical protein
MSSRKVSEASWTVTGADPPDMKICRKEETPVATKKVVEASLVAVNAEVLPGREDEKVKVPVASHPQWWWTLGHPLKEQTRR